MAVRLVWTGQRAISRVKRAASRGVERAGRDFIQECIDLMFEPKSGRIYPDGHQASAPFEPPASHTGRFINRFQLVVKELKDGPVARVVNKAPYHEALEGGAPHMLPRPLFGVALDNVNVQAKTLRTIRGEMTAEFKKK